MESHFVALSLRGHELDQLPDEHRREPVLLAFDKMSLQEQRHIRTLNIN